MPQTPEEKAAAKAAKDAEKARAEAETKAKADAEAAGVSPTPPGGDMADVFGTQSSEPLQAAPSPSSVNPPAEQGNVSLTREQFDTIMARLSDLDRTVAAQAQPSDAALNPLIPVTANHVVRVAYYGDDLVVGYKTKVRPDGKHTFTFMKMHQETGEMRTYITVILEDAETNAVKEATLDYVEFLEALSLVDATVVERKDIGEVQEHGKVEVMVWNGRQMVGTGQQIMTGAREQRFLFKVQLGDRQIQMPQEVINIL